MQEQHGQKDTLASIEGSRLHENIAKLEDSISRDTHRFIPILIIILTLVLAYLWIFG